MNADIFIPVRLNSLRLPNKHLKVIGEKPLLQHLIDRLKTAQKIRNVVVCTTTNVSDDPLIQFLENEKISYFRGNEKDILVRFLDAAKRYGTDIIVDVEGEGTDATFTFRGEFKGDLVDLDKEAAQA